MRKGIDVFSAVTLPVAGIALMALPVVPLGWSMKWDLGVLVAGLVWGAVSLVSCLMAILGVGLLAGWPLMWGTVSAEGSDAFDAISRSYAYTFQRPLNYLFYAALAAGLGIIGWAVAWCFAETLINFSLWSVELGCGREQLQAMLKLMNDPAGAQQAAASFRVGTTIAGVTMGLVRCLASAHSFSFFWCAAGAIYLMLRRDTDQTELGEVFAEELQAAA